MAPDLQVSVSREGSSAVVCAQGELDLATAELLEGPLRDLLESPQPVRRLLLDTSQVSFIDVAGMRVVLTAASGLGRRGGSVVLRAPSPQVVRLLDLLRIDLPVEP